MSYSVLLRIEAFRNLWLGQAISQLGDSFYYVSFMFMVQKFTGSIAMVGYVGVCETVPYLLFSLYGGVVADRLDRRRIMLCSDLLSGLMLCALAILVWILGKPPIWALMVTPFLLSSVRSFFMPAKNATIPAIVPAEALMPANALSSMTQNIMPMVSLSLTAGVLSLLYSSSPMLFLIAAVLLNSLSFFGSALFIFRLPSVKPNREIGQEAHPWSDLKKGLAYIKSRRAMVTLLAVSAGLNLAVSPFFVVYVAANNTWFGGKPQVLASFELSFFAGMFLGSLAVGRLKIRWPGLTFCLSTAVVGVVVVAMAWSPHIGLFLCWNISAGLAVPFASIPIMTWVQATVPDAFQGRVNSVMTMLQIGVMPIGLALGGILVAREGLQWAFGVMGGGMALAALLGLFDPAFRKLSMPQTEEIVV